MLFPRFGSFPSARANKFFADITNTPAAAFILQQEVIFVLYIFRLSAHYPFGAIPPCRHRHTSAGKTVVAAGGKRRIRPLKTCMERQWHLNASVSRQAYRRPFPKWSCEASDKQRGKCHIPFDTCPGNFILLTFTRTPHHALCSGSLLSRPICKNTGTYMASVNAITPPQRMISVFAATRGISTHRISSTITT